MLASQMDRLKNALGLAAAGLGAFYEGWEQARPSAWDRLPSSFRKPYVGAQASMCKERASQARYFVAQMWWEGRASVLAQSLNQDEPQGRPQIH